jgi:hypothetical protein
MKMAADLRPAAQLNRRGWTFVRVGPLKIAIESPAPL